MGVNMSMITILTANTWSVMSNAEDKNSCEVFFQAVHIIAIQLQHTTDITGNKRTC